MCEPVGTKSRTDPHQAERKIDYINMSTWPRPGMQPCVCCNYRGTSAWDTRRGRDAALRLLQPSGERDFRALSPSIWADQFGEPGLRIVCHLE